MTVDPVQQADVLRRLALGELSEDDPEARAVLEASPDARAEWAELSRAMRGLDAAGGEERDVVQRSKLDVTDDDRALAQAYFGPRFHVVRARRRRWQIVWFAPLATAAVALLLWFALPGVQRTDPDPGPPGLMSGWDEDVGLELVESAWSGARVRLVWRHTADRRRLAGTTYDLVLVDPAGERELASIRGWSDREWSAELAGRPPGELLWRIVARDAEGPEGEVYAAGNGRLLPSR